MHAADGSLLGLVIGPLLGAIRTGAIGGTAIKYLARRDAGTLGLIGAGYQAQTQLAAALAVREFHTIRVFSRTAQHRDQFAEQMSRRLDRDIQAVDSARQATEDADVLICSTTSSTPVVEASWLKPGVHVNCVGPKLKDRHELDFDVFQRASRLVTDSPAQMEAIGDAFLLHGTPLADSIESLSAIVAATSHEPIDRQHTPARMPEEITLFISLGLAGTEVLLAQRLFEAR